MNFMVLLSADLFEDVYKLFSNQLTPEEMIILKDKTVTIPPRYFTRRG